MNSSWNSMSIIPIAFSFFFFFIFGAVLSDPTTRHLCCPEQGDTLLVFKNEFEIGNCSSEYYAGDRTCHPKMESWTNNSDCCNWEGNTCNAEFGEVIELNLTSSCLYGQFHSNSSLFRLQNLHFLDLSNNHLIGPIPSSIGKLSHLSYLALSSNQFSGPIPSSIRNLSHLTYLFLSSNQLLGPIPSLIGNLSHLTYLFLSSNQFSGLILSWIGILCNLIYLNLDSNKFTGQIPSSFQNLSNLIYLNLDSNKFTGQIPSSFGKLTNLIFCDISNNKIEGQVPGWLWKLPNLEYLELSNNSFIGFERSSKHGQSSIRTPSRIKFFSGSNNNFMGKIPSFICGLNSLITLDLSDNNFNGSIPSCIGNLKSNLLDVNLRRNRLSGGLPEDIFESLRSLDVGHNQLVGRLPRSWTHLSSLEVLTVESNKIKDTFPLWLSSLKKLKVLVLRSNLFHGPIHEVLFPELQIIDISHNHFNGTLSADYFVKWNAMSSLGENANLSNGKYMGSDYYVDSVVLMNKGVEMNFERILKL